MDPNLQAAINGDQLAISRLLFAHYGRLQQRLAAKIPASMRSLMDPEDILHQAFADAFQAIRDFRPQGEHSFEAWLFCIVEHRLQDAIKAHKTQKRGGRMQRIDPLVATGQSSAGNLFEQVIEKLPTPSRVVAKREGVGAMLVHLAALPEDYRRVIELRHLKGLEREAVAHEMKKSVDQVRGLLLRAMKVLRETMGDSSQYLSVK